MSINQKLRFDLSPTRLMEITLEQVAHFMEAVEHGDVGNQARFLALLMVSSSGRRVPRREALSQLCDLTAEELMKCGQWVADELATFLG